MQSRHTCRTRRRRAACAARRRRRAPAGREGGRAVARLVLRARRAARRRAAAAPASPAALSRDGGVVLALERLTRVRSFEPLLWRTSVEAGVTTAHRPAGSRARTGSSSRPTRRGRAVAARRQRRDERGRPARLQVRRHRRLGDGARGRARAGRARPLRRRRAQGRRRLRPPILLIGSEGTLGIVTAVWLRLIPAPEASLPVVAFYPDAAEGCAAIEARARQRACVPAALEFLDGGALAASRRRLPRRRRRPAPASS